jgi:hypothetical protein
MCNGWAFFDAFNRVGSRWRVGFDGADWSSDSIPAFGASLPEEQLSLPAEGFRNFP